jgi:LacI family transcriptional regulator
MLGQSSTLQTDKWNKLLEGVFLDPDGALPLHEQIRVALRKIILTSLSDGDVILPEMEMREILKVSKSTLRQALMALKDEGLIQRRSGVGTQVTKRQDRTIRQIAVIAPDYPSSVIDQQLLELDLYAQKSHISSKMIRFQRGDSWKELQTRLSFGPEEGGVVLIENPPRVTAELTRVLHEKGYRTVTSTYIDDYQGHFVGADEVASVRLGVQRLKELGHRRIALLVAEPEEYDVVKIRSHAFEESAREFGLSEASVLHCGVHSWESDIPVTLEGIQSLWESSRRPSAVFFVSDESAVAALGWLQKSGVSVPREVSLLSYDGTYLTTTCCPRLSTLIFPRNCYAKEMVDVLQKDFTGYQRRTFPAVVVERETTLQPPTLKPKI